MKRYLIPVFILLTLVVLTIGGNRILARILDEQLAPLLTEQLGLPVRLAPIKAHIPTLTAKTARLEMGHPDALAVLATDVQVSLNWSDLLNREIRLITGTGDELTLQLSHWPSSDSPLPKDYYFLDQWLPRDLSVSELRYIDAKGSTYSFMEPHWKRLEQGGASLNWKQIAGQQTREFETRLNSLKRLLGLQDIELESTLQVADEPGSRVTVDTTLEDESAGYSAHAQVEASGLNMRISAYSEAAWEFPEQSQTRVSSLDLKELRETIANYFATGDAEAEGSLDKALPRLVLPDHQGHVALEKISFASDTAINNSFDFTLSADGLRVKNLISHGPKGVLEGYFTLTDEEGRWQLELNADLEARENGQLGGEAYLGADWSWHSGGVHLRGSGNHLGSLLNSLAGDLSLAGNHRGAENTPLHLSATLDNDSSRTHLDQLEITVGEGRISGSASLTSEGETRRLELDLDAREIDLDFLATEEDAERQAGVVIPSYLTLFRGIDLDWKIRLIDLKSQTLAFSTAEIGLVRTLEGGTLDISATGLAGGSLNLLLDADAQEDELSEVTLSTTLKNMDLATLFGQDYLLHSRTTGTIDFSARGNGLEAIFRAMQGSADLNTQFRRHNDWDRPSREEEQLALSGDSRWVIEGDRIIGVEIDNLNIDSIQQDVSGKLSLVAKRDPWMIADLEASRLDISGFIDLLPESTAQADRGDLLQTLRDLGAASISVNSQAARYSDYVVSDLALEITSGADRFALEQLDFTFEGDPFRSQGTLSWRGDEATLSARASIEQFDLDRFLVRDPDIKHIPVSGSLELKSTGTRFAQLLANVNGRLELASTQATQDTAQRRALKLTAKRVPEGLHAAVDQFHWGENELRGSLVYRDIERDRFDITIEGGSVSLAVWEAQLDKVPQGADAAEQSGLGGAAAASAALVNNILSAPRRLFSGPGESAPGDKLFDKNPLPFDALKDFDASLTANLGKVHSRVGQLDDLSVSGNLEQGRLDLKAKSGAFNRGQASLDMQLDTVQSPPSISLELHFEDTMGNTGKPTFPRSGFLSVQTKGHNTADIAASLNGQVYLELGKGPFDYANVSLLTSDMASQVATTLIPGVEKSQPSLECGVALATFDNGIGTTPVGYTLRTDQANIIGRMEIDLQKELIEIALDSRSREGVGLSVGNVFSNTIRVKGPLTDPQIVPHATGLLWRGWAAFMTAGLSVVGESVIKRALAAENPCKSLKKDIRKNICDTNQPMAKSPLVCKQAAQ